MAALKTGLSQKFLKDWVKNSRRMSTGGRRATQTWVTWLWKKWELLWTWVDTVVKRYIWMCSPWCTTACIYGGIIICYQIPTWRKSHSSARDSLSQVLWVGVTAQDCWCHACGHHQSDEGHALKGCQSSFKYQRGWLRQDVNSSMPRDKPKLAVPNTK